MLDLALLHFLSLKSQLLDKCTFKSNSIVEICRCICVRFHWKPRSIFSVLVSHTAACKVQVRQQRKKLLIAFSGPAPTPFVRIALEWPTWSVISCWSRRRMIPRWRTSRKLFSVCQVERRVAADSLFMNSDALFMNANSQSRVLTLPTIQLLRPRCCLMANKFA